MAILPMRVFWARFGPRPLRGSPHKPVQVFAPGFDNFRLPNDMNRLGGRNRTAGGANRLDPSPRYGANDRAKVFHQRKAPGLKREWDKGEPEQVPETPAAPATVTRRAGFQPATALDRGGKAKVRIDPQARRPALHGCNMWLSGVTVGRTTMSTITLTKPAFVKPAIAALAPVLFVALLGGLLLFAAGHAQSAALHDAAHDVRHATGFPCH